MFEKHGYHAVTIYVKTTSESHAHVHAAVPGSTPIARRLAAALLDTSVFDAVLAAALRENPNADQLKDLASNLWSECALVWALVCDLLSAGNRQVGALIRRTPLYLARFCPRTPVAPPREPHWQAQEAARREASGLA